MTAPYNIAFVCLECCKSFKRYCNMAIGVPDELPCPECGRASYNVGRHFKAPRRADKAQWEKIRLLIGHGFYFQKIRIGPGHHDTMPYPKTLAEAREFVERYKRFAINRH